MKKTEWIFACNADGGTIPTLIRFVTNKSSEEIQKNYSDNTYGDKTGKVAVSLWYCDEYTEEYDNYGHECTDYGWASKDAYDLDDPAVKVLNLDAIPVVDLDVELNKDKVNDTGDYDGWIW